MSNKTMMKCGHAANGYAVVGGEKVPACVICAMGRPNEPAVTVDDNPPDLSQRQAKCSYCHCVKPSGGDLAFFSHKPGREFDDFYCGCRGWD